MKKRAGDGRRSSRSSDTRRMMLALVVGGLSYAATPCSAQTTEPSQPPRILAGKKVRPIWEPIFFQAINERASKSGLLPLRSYTVPGGDVEVRVWDGFGLSQLVGVVLKRTHGVWSATFLHAAFDGFEGTRFKRAIPAPKGGGRICGGGWSRGDCSRSPIRTNSKTTVSRS